MLKQLIPGTLRRPLGRSRRFAAWPAVAWAQLWPIGEALAALAPPRRPPLLLVSLPRGGSSWAGRILGGSDASLYLHEPLTQSYLAALGGRGASEFEYAACRDRRAYDRIAALMFSGVPRFHESVVLYPEQWRLAGRRRRHI
ncbi:MAG TPA: hypothetical protein VE631_10625, partial [Alphaproteobacteria bacterium]|nr:hypothetical protein [Alphaproteobacteria bacterium]